MVGMMAIDSVDTNLLLVEASDLAAHPGALPESSVSDFLAKYPFPVLFSVLSTAETPELVSAIVNAVEKILQSPFGHSMLIGVLPYANAGLNAASPQIRRLACFSITKYLEDGDSSSVQTAADAGIMDPLLSTICDEDSSVAKEASDAIENLAKSSAGLEVIFGASQNSLKELAIHGSSLVQIRALSLAARIFGLSDVAAAAVQTSGILSVLEGQLKNSSDTLAQLNAFEILSELAETPAGARLLLAGTFVSQLVFWIQNAEVDSMVRSRSMQVASRLIKTISEPDALQIIDAIGNCLGRVENFARSSERWDKDEKDAALDALGQIGSFSHGAQVLLLRGARPPALYVVHSAFKPELAGIHALALIAGSEREDVLLNEQAENVLRDLIFDAIHVSSQKTLSNSLLHLLKQTAELRQAVYRLLVPLASRTWCLLEVSSNDGLVDFIVDSRIESSKQGMEWRHACCAALATGLRQAILSVRGDTLEKLNEAARRGPYLSKDHAQAIPVVATQERF
ncbi:hypothetical protein SELMODRAFT_442892 [Selaginella moellendorffii]|uniref:26S proteasome non-ATPase regulatory subunit 5 n=1 Tax=Selaginella moellendorffii TaxID=88036 RepID=D8RWY0_SELML|nr:uncharacterized protein LOC9645255 [Selaginella moellendorffii]EFJ23338.1 hypothetical protein SELMODRAFT_442892 [Selaginella moellendorffii]|eukprot:XP_002975709.1 uncharacterized protein LOC9645255 [Selaginella moellendorffii]